LVLLGLGYAPLDPRGLESGQVQAAGEAIVVGATVGLVPWEYLDKSGRLTGFEIEMLRLVGKRLDRPVKFIDVQSDAMFAGLLSGKYQILASALAILCQRQKQADFSVPYYAASLAAFVRKDDPRIRTAEDLRGMIIGVEGSSSSSHAWLTANQERYGFKEIKVYQDMPSTFLDLEAGRIDAVVQSAPTGSYYIRGKPRLEMRVQGLRGTALTGLAFRKGDLLRAQVDEALNKMKADGTMARLHFQQIGYAPSAESPTVKLIPSVPVPEGSCP